MLFGNDERTFVMWYEFKNNYNDVTEGTTYFIVIPYTTLVYIIMNIETSSRTESRKRNRQPNFDLNSSIQHALPKVRRKESPNIRMSNPQNTSRSQIIDMSHTINSGAQAQNMNNSHSNVIGNTIPVENITPEVRDLVADEALVVQRSLEDKIKKMVQDEMSSMRKSVEVLTKAVSDLSKITSQNQQAIIANPNTSNPSTSDNSTDLNDRLNHRLVSDQCSENNTLNSGNAAYPGQRVQLSVSGAAREWYCLFTRTHSVIDWPGLRHALQSQYQTTRSNF
ncbi:hypothetical protein CVS40_10498 [Lucilia cuprina]|nr:hypothetical protein CVS40_10498 [Lucilia cuprina]